MLCTGLIKRHYNNLFNEKRYDEYYTKHSKIMNDVVFKDTYTVCRFIPLYYDIILKTHKDIEYVLRNSENAASFYNALNDIQIEDVNDILSIPYDLLTLYYNEVCQKIILPLMKRHEVYSQGIMQLLFYKLVIYTLLKFSIDNEYKSKLTIILNNIHKPSYFIANIKPFDSSYPEFSCWKKYSTRNNNV